MSTLYKHVAPFFARVLALALFASASTLIGADTATKPPHWQNAPTPPMGWNSWDVFGTTVTEAQTKEQADAMAAQLKACGWNLIVVDIQWYEGNSKGHDYKEGAHLTMDGYSRLMPALNKFPSAKDGAGFRPLADYVHAKGLKFGIHIMRGISRQAVRENTAILGTSVKASDIALKSHTCPWNPDMYGVDMTKPGAQEYYDSLFALYASWGVDFVKVDDISRAYDDVQKAEVEAIRRAIDKCGRPMVLSLSPGDTPIERGEHVVQHANMWRISDDFWDRWEPLQGMFGRLHKWTAHRAEGAWPDADMLPFGIVEFNRATRFTQDEQTLCMTLWCIARSPLIFGGDMTKLDPFTLNLLTNPEVLGVNQKSTGNRQLSRDSDIIVWTAKVPGSADHYVALFNAQGNESPLHASQALYRSGEISGEPGAMKADISVPLGKARKLTLVVSPTEDGAAHDHADWINPALTGPSGTLKLTQRQWTKAEAGWGKVLVNRTVEDKPLTLHGEPVEGIGAHARSVIEFDIPQGYDTFSAQGVLSADSAGKGTVEFQVFTDTHKVTFPDRSAVIVALKDLGITGSATVRDLWARKDIGVVSGEFSREIPLHGAGLYRISPQK